MSIIGWITATAEEAGNTLSGGITSAVDAVTHREVDLPAPSGPRWAWNAP